MGESPSPHIPVMVQEVFELLRPQPGEVFIDGTLGAGGHTNQLLAAGARVIGLDCDGEALLVARQRLATWADAVTFHRVNFTELGEVMGSLGIQQVQGVLLDLGLSSMQLASRQRGFSFLGEGDLDMRMDDRLPTKASSFLATTPESKLADIFWNYGEERASRALAAAVVKIRRRAPITTVRDFVALVSQVVRPSGKIHPATRAFQALRIAVNGELKNLETVLPTGFQVLAPGGRMVVISYHSLEDRIVKHFFRGLKMAGEAVLLTRKPVRASADEVRANPRSRSALLRAVEKIKTS